MNNHFISVCEWNWIMWPLVMEGKKLATLPAVYHHLLINFSINNVRNHFFHLRSQQNFLYYRNALNVDTSRTVEFRKCLIRWVINWIPRDLLFVAAAVAFRILLRCFCSAICSFIQNLRYRVGCLFMFCFSFLRIYIFLIDISNEWLISKQKLIDGLTDNACMHIINSKLTNLVTLLQSIVPVLSITVKSSSFSSQG